MKIICLLSSSIQPPAPLPSQISVSALNQFSFLLPASYISMSTLKSKIGMWRLRKYSLKDLVAQIDEEQRAEAGKGHLMICFTDLGFPASPMYYTFEWYSVRKLLDRSSKRELIEPDGKFDWREVNDDPSTPHYFGMSFLKVENSVYAVGGLHHDKERDIHFYDPGVPSRRLICIDLENRRVEHKEPMCGRKYCPLIVEIGGLIYVLSGPTRGRGPSIDEFGFQVYRPLDDKWKTLPNPPFLKRYSDTFWVLAFGYAVIGTKLLVSTWEYSCIYDTVEEKWEACELFSRSDFNVEYDEPWYPYGCGPPAPFMRKATLYKGDTLLCIMHRLTGEPQVSALSITDGKAVENPILFEDRLPFGNYFHLVDMGNDFFAALLFEEESAEFSHSDKRLTIATFKLHSEIGKDGTRLLKGRGLLLSTCDTIVDEKAEIFNHPIYSVKM